MTKIFSVAFLGVGDSIPDGSLTVLSTDNHESLNIRRPAKHPRTEVSGPHRASRRKAASPTREDLHKELIKQEISKTKLHKRKISLQITKLRLEIKNIRQYTIRGEPVTVVYQAEATDDDLSQVVST